MTNIRKRYSNEYNMKKAMIKNWSLIITTLVLVGCNKPNPNEPREQYLKGDLGGMPVDLPRNIVELVEYDGDPGWGEKRQGKVPKRTYQSKINSMGFDIRYTDGTLLDRWDAVSRKVQQEEDMEPDSPWVSVGFNSGNRYHGRGGTHRIGHGTIHPSYEVFEHEKYLKLPELEHGLEVYAQTNIYPKTQKPFRLDPYSDDVFIERDAEGKVITYIECTNRNLKIYATFPVTQPPCTLYFDLPKIDAYVYATFSRHTLADWKKIQQQIIKATLSFRARTREKMYFE